jgi:hypothetical protein
MAGITWAIDLTPLVGDPAPSVEEFVAGLVARFQADVVARIRSYR